MPPARAFAVLTCMDARLDPAKYAGLSEGDAHVIRNAGGRASDDAIRSLVISYKLLGTREWFVIHHTDCGMLTFTDDVMRGLLASSLETSSVDESGWHDHGAGPGSTEANFIDWLTISDNAQCVVADVRRIREHPPGARQHPDLRLHLRLQERPPGRGSRGKQGGQGVLIPRRSGRLAGGFARPSCPALTALAKPWRQPAGANF
jgi:carbonic anhydrase